MLSAARCSRCGAVLAADAPGGQCPACLLSLAFTADLDSAAAARSFASHGRGAPGRAARYFADYELEEELARGGMGVVYRARQLSLNRPVALKMVLEGPLASPGFLTRFQVEAEAAARLAHPHIVRIYEIGEHDGRQFFSMELYEGGDLRDRMADFALPAPAGETPGAGPNRVPSRSRQQRIALLLATVAEAVHHAHQRGVLHRDLKPANILFDQDDQPHVTDFGLAKLMADESLLTQSGAVLGTPAYMAPEQARGGAATIASDVYSLGAILYHLLCGRPPFQGPTALETMRLAVEEDPVAPAKLNPLVDPDLQAIALKCLSKEPALRYASMQALARDLRAWVSGGTILARPATRPEQLARWCRRKPAIAGLSAAVALLLLGVAVISVFAAFRIERARQAAVAAQQKALDELWRSYLDQARARRWSGRSGRRFEALRAITQAAALHRSVELRNEAVAALALPDLNPLPGGPPSKSRADRVALDFTHDRYLFVEAGQKASVRALGSNTELFPLATGGIGIASGGFSPDGRWLLLTCTNGACEIWDLSVRRRVWRTSAEPEGVAFSPDSRQFGFSTAEGQFVIVPLLEPAAAKVIPLGAVLGVPDWSPDGKYIAGINRGEILLADLSTGTLANRIHFDPQPLRVAWHPDGKRLAVGGADPNIRLLQMPDGKELARFSGHLAATTCVRFSTDGNLLASDSWDGTLRVWETETGKELSRVAAGAEGITFSPDDRRLAVYSWGQSQVNLFALALNRANTELGPPGQKPREGSGCALLFGPGGDWLATSADQSLTLWAPGTGRLLARFDHRPSDTLLPLPGGEGLFGWSPAGFFRLRTGNSLPQSARLEPFVPRVPAELRTSCPAEFSSAFEPARLPERSSSSRDGRVAALAYKNRCYIFDLEAGALRAITGPQPWMKFVAVSPDGQRIATSGWHNPNVKIWNAATGALEAELPTDTMPNVAFSPNGRWLVSSTGSEYCFWRTTDWQPVRRLPRVTEGDLPGPMAFSADGKLLAMAYTTRVVHLVAADTGQLLAQLEPAPDNEIVAFAFSPDDSELALTRVGAPVQVWHLGYLRRELAALGLDW